MSAYRPAVRFCVPLIAGILIGKEYPLPIPWLIGILLGLLTAAAIALLREDTRDAGSLLISLAVFSFGMLKITADSPRETIEQIAGTGRQVVLMGRISDLPRLTRRTVRCVVDVESLRVRGQNAPVSGGILLIVRRPAADSEFVRSLRYGSPVVARGELEPLARSRNPGEFDPREFFELNNIYAQCFVPVADSVTVGAVRPGFLSSMVYPVRRTTADLLDRTIGGPESAFLKGLMIGDRSQIQPELKDLFVNSGVMHIIAVAGLHVGMMTAIMSAVFFALRLPRAVRFVLLGLSLLFYMFLTGSAHPVVRAVVMAIVLIGGAIGERKGDVYNSLAFAAIVLLLVDAKNLFQAGFQLSFATVFWIITLYPKCVAILLRIPLRSRLYRYIAELVAVSLTATIGSVPFTSLYFGKISLIGPVANLVIVPMTGVVLALGVATVTISSIWSWLGGAYGALTKVLAHLLLAAVAWFGSLPHAYLDSQFSPGASILFYGVTACFAAAGDKRQFARVVIITLLTGVIMVFGPLVRTGDLPVLRVTVLDIGQGDAIFIELPDHRNLLVDAGPRVYDSDAGRRFIEPFLRGQGIRRLNAVVLTHPHSDHLGGMPYLLRHIDVDEVVDAGSDGRSALWDEYLHVVDSLHTPRRVIHAGTALTEFSNVRIYVLHPPDSYLDTARGANFNNQSLVLKLIYGRSSILLSGDAEREVEERLGSRYGGLLRSDILKAGHHGSVTSSTPEYLSLVRPGISLVSVGVRNKFHHPSPLVIRRLSDLGSRVYRTDQSGAIVLTSDGEKWSVVEWR